MSHELLSHLADRYAFDGSPSFRDLGAYHVPFDSMTGTGRVEARLEAGSKRGERVALIAPSGAGKSSVVSYVLGPTVGGVAPIVVPVHPLEEGATSPARVADELLGLLGRYAQQVRLALPTGPTRTVTDSHRRSSGFGLALGWLQGDLGREVERQTQTESPISLREKTEIIAQVLHLIHNDGLQPVVVFDDTDRWLANTDTRTVTAYFREVIRWLTDLPTSVIVATHTHYLDVTTHLGDLLEFLDTRVAIPRVPSAEKLTDILQRRITCNTTATPYASATVTDAVANEAVEALYALYSPGTSLRHVLQVAHVALAEAVSSGSYQIRADHIMVAQP